MGTEFLAPQQSRATVATDVAVTSSYGGAGAAFSDTSVSTDVKILNTGNEPIEYQVDSGVWTRLNIRTTIPLAVNMATQTLKFRKAYLALSGTVQVQVTTLNGDYNGNGVLDRTIATSRSLTEFDNGEVLECTATVTLTVPVGLPIGFSCVVMASGTTSIASSGGALLNGATTTLTRAAASNGMFAIQAKQSAANSYLVSGS